ncbi:MAG: hypothetical protein ACP5Q4_07460 [Candidatus Caldatribacteriaceae bacterium]
MAFAFGKSEEGFLEAAIISIVGLSLVLSAILGGWIRSHGQFLQAHVEKIKEEYEIEGVFQETIDTIEAGGPGFEAENLASSFVPLYKVSIKSDTITITKNGVLLLEARFQWEDGKVKPIWAENPFVKPYAR